VLEQKAEEEAAWEELQTSEATGSRQLLLSLERTGDETARILGAAYLQVLQELAGLQADLQQGAAPIPIHPLPTALPPARNLVQALRQAREGLQDLHRLLSE